MATIQSNPNPLSSTPPPKKDNTKTTILTVAVVLLAALLGLTAFGYFGRGTKNKELQTALSETEEFKVQAEQQYYQALAELEEMRGDMEEITAIYAKQRPG